MHILPLSFGLLTYIGLWRPEHWPVNSMKYRMYNVYSSFMFILIQLFVFYGLVDISLSANVQEFVDKFFHFLAIFGVLVKIILIFICRRQIISLDEMLLKEKCTSRDADEALIRQKFKRNARQVTIIFELVNQCCPVILTVGQFFTLLKTRTLPVYSWAPCDLSSLVIFLFLLTFQFVGLLLIAHASVAHETMISGFMLEICAQFEILCHRFHILPTLLMEAEKNSRSEEDLKMRERLIIRDLVQHHLYVYKFAYTVNAVFTFVMFVQFSIISFVLCTSIYRMSNMASLLTMKFAHIIFYLASMLMQIFLYCWYGNEVMLKSIEVCNAVYKIDWTTLRVRVMKDLAIIMMRASKPYIMSSGHVVTLTAESFMSILKLSYSAYNFLKDA